MLLLQKNQSFHNKKKDFGVMPVLMVTAYDESGRVNVKNAA
jgi:hypothetical protein